MGFRKVIAGITALMLLSGGIAASAADDSYGRFVLYKDHWRFNNSAQRFNETMTMTEADYQMLMGNLKNTEKKPVLSILDKDWSGANYGMAVTSILACYDLIDYASYRMYAEDDPAISLYDMTSFDASTVSPTDEMQSLIHYYQTMQYTDTHRQKAASLMYSMTEAERLQYLLSCLEDKSPVLLRFSGKMRINTYRSSHAVVAYAVEEVSYEYEGVTYDSRVRFYDSAYDLNTGEAVENSLYFNSSDYSWCIPRYKISSAEGDNLSFITEDLSLINNGGLLEGTEEYIQEDEFMNVFTANALESAYSLSTIALTDSGWTRTEESMEHCKEVGAFYMDRVDDCDVNFLLPGEEKGYVFEIETPQELKTAMYYEDSVQYISTSSGTQIVTEPSGFVEMTGTDALYELEMVYNEGHYSGSWYSFGVSGTADTVSLSRTDAGYLLEADNLNGVTVTAGNDTEHAKLTFSADTQSVLLYEIDAANIGAAIDTDGDGTYETTIAASSDKNYGEFVMGEDNWQFQNSSSYYGDTYQYTESDRALLEEKLSNVEMYMASQLVDGEFLGSCYGMAVTSILACYDLIDYGAFRQYDTLTRKGAAVSLYDMTQENMPAYRNPTLEMQSFINYYVALQYTSAIRQDTARAMSTMTEEERLQKLIDYAEAGTPAMVGFFGAFDYAGHRNGHAVVAYDVEYGDYELYAPQIDEEGFYYYPEEPTHFMNGRIRVYDNARISETGGYYYIYFNTEDMSWYFPSYSTGSAEGGTLSMIIGDINLLNAGGILEGTEYVSNEEFLAILSTQAIHSEYDVQKIDFDNGSWTAVESSSGEIEGFPVFLGETVTSTSMDYVLSDAESGYVLHMAEPEAVDLCMNYEEILLLAESDSSSQVVLHPSGYTAISGTQGQYTLKMIFNDGNYYGSWYRFTVSGNAASVSLQRTEDGYLLSADVLEDVKIMASNDTVLADLTFSVDADSVLLYEVDETTIGAAVDTDGDGIYETPITEDAAAEPGDVNTDGAVNALDAAKILTAAAAAGSGGESGLAYTQKLAADANADGEINALDAAAVLRYAAYAGTGGSMTFAEFMVQ